MDSFYKVVGAFDTETTNIQSFEQGFIAFPVLYQYGHVLTDVESITPDNAEASIEITIARRETSIYACFDADIEHAKNYVPVILVHNLGFDMYALAPYLQRHSVRVLAKTAKKPISFQVQDPDGKPLLVFLDTLGLFMKSLKVLGDECGMPKAVGDWDYNLIRTPETPLTDSELNYAKRDIYTLLAYMGYFLRQNPDVKQSEIGWRVQTKTGVVRAKRMVHVGNAKPKNAKLKVRQFWHLLNKAQRPGTDEELFTMHAATRGGFTFCARSNASKVFFADGEHLIESYDSTSQHPAQMVSHLYPQDFFEADEKQLELAFELCGVTPLDTVLKNWLKPFAYAFYGAFEFENLQPKPGSVFEREGIFPLASARLTGFEPTYDNGAADSFRDHMAATGYCDSASNPVLAYGKIESAERATLFLTELEAWVMSRCYTWDSVRAIGGYLSSTFRKPSDMATLSVMRYYSAKDALKGFMNSYHPGQDNDVKAIEPYFPATFVAKCKHGDADKSELQEYYMLSKSDLNALFGIEATNECRRDYELLDGEIGLVGIDGIHNLPKTCKANYQFGQRIVGWSRIAQVCIMELIAPYVDNIICGDTDSLKIRYRKANKSKIEKQLKRHAKSLDKAKRLACARTRAAYPSMHSNLDGIGHYVLDGNYEAFSASWNKSYIALKDGKCKLTIAGVPTARRGDTGSMNDFCDDLMKNGMTFEQVASVAIGYNVTIHDSITKLNARIHPKKLGEYVELDVTDYLGNTAHVKAPAALALFPSVKTLGDTTTRENLCNSKIALQNNPNVNIAPVWLRWNNGNAVIEK